MVHPRGAHRNTRLHPDPALRKGLSAPATVRDGHSPPPALNALTPPTAVATRRRRGPRSIAVVLLGLILAATAFIGLTQVNPGSAMAALSGADPQMLATGIGFFFLAQTISGVMWGVCQEAGGVRGISMPTTLGVHWISRASCELLPANLGEAVRVGLVRRHPSGAEAGAWRITGGIAGYKVIDAVLASAAVLAIAVASPLPGPAGNLRWTALGAIGAIGAIALAWRLGAGARIVALLPLRVRGAASRMGEGAGVLRDSGAARTAAILGACALVARILSMAALLAAMGAPPEAAALAFAITVLAGVVPAAPGGAGTREMLLIPALVLAYGMPASTAFAFSVAIQATALATSLIVGALALAWLGPRLIFRRGTAAEPDLVPEPVLAVAASVPTAP